MTTPSNNINNSGEKVYGPFLSLSPGTNYVDEYDAKVSTNVEGLISNVRIGDYLISVTYDDMDRIISMQQGIANDIVSFSYDYVAQDTLPASATSNLYVVSNIEYDDQGLLKYSTITYNTKRKKYSSRDPTTTKTLTFGNRFYEVIINDMGFVTEVWHGEQKYAFTYIQGKMNITNYTDMRSLAVSFKSNDASSEDGNNSSGNRMKWVFLAIAALFLLILIFYLYRRYSTRSRVVFEERDILYDHRSSSPFHNPRASGVGRF